MAFLLTWKNVLPVLLKSANALLQVPHRNFLPGSWGYSSSRGPKQANRSSETARNFLRSAFRLLRFFQQTEHLKTSLLHSIDTIIAIKTKYCSSHVFTAQRPRACACIIPSCCLVNNAAKLCARKERLRKYFNRGKRVLSAVKTGETIRVRSPSGTWRPAECLREVAPRSYEVLVHGAVRRRNRKDIWRTVELQNTQTSEENAPFAEVQRAPFASPGPVPETPLVSPASSPIKADCVGESASPSPVTPPSSVPEDTAQPLTRSTRQRRPPSRFEDFIMSWLFHSYKDILNLCKDVCLTDIVTVKSQWLGPELFLFILFFR